jgi:hypothetical protein
MITENLLVFTFQVILIMIFNQLITRVHELRLQAQMMSPQQIREDSYRCDSIQTGTMMTTPSVREETELLLLSPVSVVERECGFENENRI